MSKIISAVDAATLIHSGQSVMIGGFLKCGTPKCIINELLANNVTNLTLIANDTSFVDSDRGLLIANKRVKKVIVSHVGTNPETGKQMHDGTLDVELVPQGTLVERIRAAGAGLGGVLTPTGVGTVIQNGKDIIEVDGRKFILEKPLFADVAIIYGTNVDSHGNVSFEGTTRNFNPIMATAAKTVIVEADNYIDGAMNPNDVVIPGLYIDYIVRAK